MKNWMIKTQHLTKRIKNQLILDHVSIHVPKGKIYGLLGPNGAGKTTLMKLLLQLQQPSSGTVLFLGEKVTRKNLDLFRSSGSLIEEPAFYGNLTAEENLRIFSKMRGVTKSEAVESVLQKVNLAGTGHKKFSQFSLGMKQRLGIAAALLHEPELLILDEPINGLDPLGIREIRELLLQLNQQHQTTILISSHILSEIERIVDVIGFLNKGCLIEEVTLEELKTRERDYINIKVDQLRLASCILEERLDITDFQLSEEDTLRIYDETASIPAIIEEFTAESIKIYEASHQQFHLEAYFSQLVGGGKK